MSIKFNQPALDGIHSLALLEANINFGYNANLLKNHTV
jgi:hypothetical protein